VLLSFYSFGEKCIDSRSGQVLLLIFYCVYSY